MLDGSQWDSGQATWSDDLLLMLCRHSCCQRSVTFRFRSVPSRIESGDVGGVFTAVFETTDKVIGQRRLRTLRDISRPALRTADTSRTPGPR